MTAGERFQEYLHNWPEGVIVCEAALVLGVCATTLYPSVRKMVADGIVAIGSIGRDSAMIACFKPFEAAMLERIALEKAARVEKSRLRRNANNRRYKEIERLRAMDFDVPQDDDMPIVRRVVCALEAKPLIKRGPASVFELAMAA
jgi:hypothetical protein